MEDLKRYLNEAAKHSFWIISGLILLLASIVFYLTKSSLDQAITTRIGSLESSFSKINQVKSKVSTHPNDASHKEMEKRLDGLKRDVEQAWTFQYERQKEFLTWPKEAFSQAKTHEIFDSLRPFEKRVPFPLPEKAPEPLGQITLNDRDVYRKYIAPEFEKLSGRIGSSWKFKLDSAAMNPAAGGFSPPMGTGSFAPPGMGGTTAGAALAGDLRDLVRWSEASQKELATAVLPWFGQPKPPTIHEIYYAQEDIWLLRGIMDIIAQTNIEAKENFQAVVKEIEWIRMGSKASRDAGALYATQAAAGGGSMMPGMGGGGPPGGYSGGGSGGPPAGYGAGGPGGGKGGDLGAARAAVRVDPADGRYVDMNFKPLTGAQLRAAMNLQSANDAVNAVAKRIPIRLRLKVDETQIGRLITECGNGKMMLEVLQVRYNTDPAPAVAAGGGGGGGLMEGGAKPSFGGAGGMGMMSEEGTSGGGGGGLLGAAAAVDDKGEVAIEIFGLIYLFNPPASLSQTNASAPGASPAAAQAASGTVAAPAAGATPSAGSNANGSVVGGNGATASPAAPADPASNPVDSVPKPADGVGTPGPESGDTTPTVPAGDESGAATAPVPEGAAPPVEPADGAQPVSPPPVSDGTVGTGGTAPADGGGN